MKMEGSPEAGPSLTVAQDAVSGEAQCDDRFSDEDHETELEALQHLPPDERRKALRRLRNRESARRVRARRLQEMSVMENTVGSLQEENVALKEHVSKLQNHIQSMTLKIYEVTAKYEAAVAENVQLRSELHRARRPSNLGESSFLAPAATAGPLMSAGTAAEPELSPFVVPCPAPVHVGRRDSGSAGQSGPLGAAHAQLRSSSPMDMVQQKQALDEVVALLQAHKRRHQGTAQDRSGVSEIGSSAPTNTVAVKAHSPALDMPAPGIVPTVDSARAGAGGGAAVSHLTYSGSGTGPSNAAGAAANAGPVGFLAYNGSGSMGHHLGSLTLHPRATPLDVSGRAHSDALLLQQQQHRQQAQHLQLTACQGVEGGGGAMCHLSLTASANLGSLPASGQMQAQGHQPFAAAAHGPASSFNLMAQQQQQHAQQLQQHQNSLLLQQAAMQGPGHSLIQMQALQQQQQQPLQFQHPQGAHQHQHNAPSLQQHVCQLQPGGSGVMYSGMSAVSATFYSASSVLQGGHGGVCGAAGAGSGPLQLHGPPLGQAAADLGSGTGGHGSMAGGLLPLPLLERPGCAAGSNVVSLHGPSLAAWQGGGGGACGVPGSVGLAPLRAEDFTEDLFRSLDEYVPQDL